MTGEGGPNGPESDRVRPEGEPADRIERIVDNAPVVLYAARLADVATTTYISPNVEELFGHPPGAFLEDPAFWRNRIHPDDRDRALSAFARAIEGGTGGKAEYRFRDAEGSYRWIEDGFRVIRPHGEEDPGLFGYFLDVTRRKEVEEKLRDSEELFRQVVEHIDEIFWLTDENDEMLYLSPAYEEIFGRPVEEVYDEGRAWLESVHPDDRRRVEAALGEQAHGGFDEEFRVVRPDGEVRWIRDRAFPILDDAGRIYRIAGVAQDITARKRSERQFDSLIENAADVILHMGEDARIRYASPAAEEMLDLPLDRVVGRNALSFIHPDDREIVRGEIQELLSTPAGEVRVSHRIIRSDGSVRHAESVARNLIHVEAVGGVVVNTRDVTEQVELEAQLRQAQKMEAVGRLAGGVAHDFNNILTVVEGHAELLVQDLPPGSEQRESAAEILEAARRAAGLTSQLLDFGRRQMLETRTVDLSECVRGMRGILHRTIRADVEIRFELSETPLPIRADPTRIEQVILNLVVNARDAMPDGGKLLIATHREVVESSERQTDGAAGVEAQGTNVSCVLTVSDTGEGIPEELQDRIFEPFFSTREEGSGLGLATVYGIVEQSGGTMVLESDPGRGTTFTVRFPRAEEGGGSTESPPRHRASGRETKDPASTGRREEPPTALIVEHDDALRSLLARILRRDGFRVLTTTTEEEALGILGSSGTEVAVVITQTDLPEDSGAELARSALIRSEAGILFVSADDGSAPPPDVLVSSRTGHIAKPFRPSDLVEQVRGLLGDLSG